jgi:hypothetical protein
MRLLFEGRFGQALKRAGEAHAANPCAGSGGAARGTRRTALGEAEKGRHGLSAPAATIYGWAGTTDARSRNAPRRQRISRRLRRHFSVCRPNLAATSRRFAPSCAHSRVAPTGRRCCAWCACSRSAMVWHRNWRRKSGSRPIRRIFAAYGEIPDNFSSTCGNCRQGRTAHDWQYHWPRP